MNDTLPLAVVFSSHDGEDDNHSELTPGQFEINLNERDNSRETHPSHMHPPPPSSWGVRSFVDDNVPVKEEQQQQQQELVGLKLQLALYKERVDVLSSKLSRAQVENETLKCDKKYLLNELSLAKNKRPVATRRFSFRGLDAGTTSECNAGGSMQLLLDTNARLMDENSCLHASVDGIKKSFQNHIKYSLRSGREDEEAMQILRRENEVLKQQLNLENEVLKQPLSFASESNPAKPSKRHSLSEDTAKTTWASDDTSEEHQEYAKMLKESHLPLKKLDEMKVDSSHCSRDKQDAKSRVSGHVRSDGAGDEDRGARDGAAVDDINIGKKSKGRKKAHARRRTEELLVDFGIRRPSRTPREASHKRWQSLTPFPPTQIGGEL